MTAPRLAPGQIVAGKYQVQALLGEGGSSASYRAVTSQGREVALRLFDPAIGQRADVMGALQQTSGAVNALPAEGVLHVLDAGFDPSTSAPFLARDLCPTTSLAQIAPQRPLPLDAVARLTAGLGRVLDAAHERGLVHHALKPANIFVDAGSPQSPRVADFGAGLARAALPTQEGYALAAPWIAPEQAQGQAGPAADVFSAALCAFFALTGRSYWRAFQGPTPDLASWQRELMSPRTPASARAAELGVQLGSSMDAIFQRGLALDPSDRFRSVGELGGALTSALFAGSAATMALPTSAFVPPPGMGGADPLGSTMTPQDLQTEPFDAQRQRPDRPRAMMATALPAEARPPSKLVPILLIGAAVLLVGGGAAAFLLTRKPGTPDAGTPVAVTPQAPPTGTATAGAAEPLPTGEPAASATAPAADAGPAGPVLVDVSITCDPPCEEIKVDGTRVDDVASTLKLEPGPHKITVGKGGYASQTEIVKVEEGKPLERTFALVSLGPAPKTTGSGPTKPCGKFLKRCK